MNPIASAVIIVEILSRTKLINYVAVSCTIGVSVARKSVKILELFSYLSNHLTGILNILENSSTLIISIALNFTIEKAIRFITLKIKNNTAAPNINRLYRIISF